MSGYKTKFRHNTLMKIDKKYFNNFYIDKYLDIDTYEFNINSDRIRVNKTTSSGIFKNRIFLSLPANEQRLFENYRNLFIHIIPFNHHFLPSDLASTKNKDHKKFTYLCKSSIG